MRFHVLACDYDGTLATAGRIGSETVVALRRVRESGRRLVLVTGRQFDDLVAICSELDLFDQVVAENGAVLFGPPTRRVEDLGEAPPRAFLDALRRRRAVLAAIARRYTPVAGPGGDEPARRGV